MEIPHSKKSNEAMVIKIAWGSKIVISNKLMQRVHLEGQSWPQDLVML